MDPIKAKAELLATQYMIANLYAVFLFQQFGDNTLARYRELADGLKSNLSQWTVPGIDAALSDHIAAEMQTAIEFQLGLVDQMIQGKMAAYKGNRA